MGKTNFAQSIGSAFRRISESKLFLFTLKTNFNFFVLFNHERVDELYRFLNSWVAHIYGDLDEEALKLRGFELIQHDTEWANNRTSSKVQSRLCLFTLKFLNKELSFQDGGDIGDEIGEYTRESWEVSLSKTFEKKFYLLNPQKVRR